MSGHDAVDAPAGSLWTLRGMTAADVAAVLAIERRSFPSPWSRASFEHEIGAAWAAPLVAVEAALDGQRIVGYACAWNVADEVHLLNVAVHPERRRAGIGEGLVRAVLDRAVARQARAVVLEVRVSNLGARRLYGRLAFRTVAVRRDYYGAGQDGMLMEWRPGR